MFFSYGIITLFYYLWRILTRAASLERRCKDAQKRTPRNIDTQYEGMELHRRCPENVDAEMSFRIILFSITEKRILFSTSVSHVFVIAVLYSASLPLVLMFPVRALSPIDSACLFWCGVRCLRHLQSQIA